MAAECPLIALGDDESTESELGPSLFGHSNHEVGHRKWTGFLNAKPLHIMTRNRLERTCLYHTQFEPAQTATSTLIDALSPYADTNTSCGLLCQVAINCAAACKSADQNFVPIRGGHSPAACQLMFLLMVAETGNEETVGPRMR